MTKHDTSKYGERVARIRNHIRAFETIGERLQDEGYTTLAFTANPWTSADNEFDTGFDQFHEVGRTGGSIIELFRNTLIEKGARLFDRWINDDTWFCTWRTFYDDVIKAIDDVQGPVFAWIFLLNTHNPYIVPRRDRRESSAYGMYSSALRANDALNRTDTKTHYRTALSYGTLEDLRKAYRDSVRSVDMFVGRLRTDTDDDTALVVYSDHGEAFGEHGIYGHQPVLYEENIHVPLLAYDGEARRRVDETVSTVVVPEITLSLARDEEVDPTEWTTDYAFSRTESDSAMAIRGARWKYILTETGPELYDLDEDPHENSDVSDEYPDRISEFETRREAYLEALPDLPSSTGSIESEDMKDHLESLGYL